MKRQLDAQFSRKSKEKRLALVQALGKAVRDEPPNQRELELFWEDMDLWGNLDARVVTAPAHPTAGPVERRKELCGTFHGRDGKTGVSRFERRQRSNYPRNNAIGPAKPTSQRIHRNAEKLRMYVLQRSP